MLALRHFFPGILLVTLFFMVLPSGIRAQDGPMSPMKEDKWLLNFGFGAGTPFFGNGIGFGPAAKVAFEKGMWQVGPGVITLGAEMTFSYFSNKFGEGWHEYWLNCIMGARGSYHYGWQVKGLDTYAGVPLGFGLCMNLHDRQNGYHKFVPVYPYFGIFFGGSYFFTPDFGINGEFGYNSTYCNLGLIFRL